MKKQEAKKASPVSKPRSKDPLGEQERTSFGNVGGATRQKVELGVLIKNLLEQIELIDNNEELSRAEKTKRLGRLAHRVRTKLYEDRRKKDDDKLKATTYRRYLTDIRKAITAKNWRHHAIEESCRRMAKHHPRYAEQLLAMAAMDDITTLRIAHRDLKNDIRRAGDDAAYKEIREMKLDHEIMRHLSLPMVTRDQLGEKAAEVLEHKATNTIEINYHWLVKTASELLTQYQDRGDGSSPYYSYLALGVAMATGRRAIEVLKQGRFKKVGEFELEFSGQAKQRMGVDYSSSYRIYTLLSADIVLEAIKRLRELPAVIDLQDKSNTEVNRRTAKTLNTLTKRVFKDESRVFKDTRAIWARVVFEAHFKHDKRWRKVNEEVFWREMLGHEDMDTQESYKQFKVDYTEPSEGSAPAEKTLSRLEALQALDSHPSIQGREAMEKIHSWVKATVKAEPAAKIIQRSISVNVGSYRPIIQEYLALAAEALSAPVRPLNTIAAEIPREVANAKPHLVTHRADDGLWVAVLTLNGVEVARGEGADRMAASREAFTQLAKA
jgi:hypothetical protein